MFGKSAPAGSSIFTEATVETVDIKRSVCKCRTDKRQYLNDVRWGYTLGQSKERGDNNHPIPGERVVLINVRGDRYIFMSLGLTQIMDASIRSSISRGRGSSEFHSRYNHSVGEDYVRREGSVPTEMVTGDKVYTGERGSLFGLLKGGTFVAKASGLAQLLISRVDDLFRIVSRNYEMFSEGYTHYSINLRGRLYNYLGFYHEQASSRKDSPDYYEMFGDVAAGEEAKENYLLEDLVLPDKDTILKLQRIPAKDVDGEVIGTRWLSTYSSAGKRVEVASTFDSGVVCTITSEEGHWRVEVESGGNQAFLDVTPVQILSQVNGCTVTQTGTTIQVNAPSSVTVISPVVSVEASTSATVNSPTVTIQASTKARFETPSIELVGCTMTGDAGSDVVMNGISLKNHKHTSGPPGSPTSVPIP